MFSVVIKSCRGECESTTILNFYTSVIKFINRGARDIFMYLCRITMVGEWRDCIALWTLIKLREILGESRLHYQTFFEKRARAPPPHLGPVSRSSTLEGVSKGLKIA